VSNHAVGVTLTPGIIPTACLGPTDKEVSRCNRAAADCWLIGYRSKRANTISHCGMCSIAIRGRYGIRVAVTRHVSGCFALSHSPGCSDEAREARVAGEGVSYLAWQCAHVLGQTDNVLWPAACKPFRDLRGFGRHLPAPSIRRSRPIVALSGGGVAKPNAATRDGEVKLQCPG
jgi:hypothetical protein